MRVLALEVLRGTVAVPGDAFAGFAPRWRRRRHGSRSDARSSASRAARSTSRTASPAISATCCAAPASARWSRSTPAAQRRPRRQAEALQRECLLAGGDDYELVFTAAAERRDAVAAAARASATPVTRIGRIEAGSGCASSTRPGASDRPGASFDHFLPAPAAAS
jgi:thiamine-monophosphate kinase